MPTSRCRVVKNEETHKTKFVEFEWSKEMLLPLSLFKHIIVGADYSKTSQNYEAFTLNLRTSIKGSAIHRQGNYSFVIRIMCVCVFYRANDLISLLMEGSSPIDLCNTKGAANPVPAFESPVN